jgi:hypothetical protein
MTIHCQEFHELAMDYRGAGINHAQAAYEALLAYTDARIAATPAAVVQAEPSEVLDTPPCGRWDTPGSWIFMSDDDWNEFCAAPYLLAALSSFPGFLSGTVTGDAWIEQTRAAIAKATWSAK